MYGCQQVLLKPDKELSAILEFLCRQAHSLTNMGIYYARQLYLKAKRYVGKYDLEKLYKNNLHYKVFHSQAAQQILRSVYESFVSYKKLVKAYREGGLENKPRLPKYRKKGGKSVSIISWSSFKIKKWAYPNTVRQAS